MMDLRECRSLFLRLYIIIRRIKAKTKEIHNKNSNLYTGYTTCTAKRHIAKDWSKLKISRTCTVII